MDRKDLDRANEIKPVNRESMDPQARCLRYPGSDLLLDWLPIGIVLQDARGEIAAANAAAEGILGRSMEAMRGMRFVETAWPVWCEDGAPFQPEEDPATKALRDGEPVRDLVMGIFNPERDELIWIKVSTFPLPAPVGDVLTGVYTVVEDISVQRRAQAQQTASEAGLQAVFTAMSEGMALHRLVFDDAGRPQDYRILDVNPAFEAQTGLVRASVVAQLASVAYGTGSAPFLERYAQVAQSGQPQVFEQYFEPLQRYFRISVFSPEPEHFATIFQDITERVALEQQIGAARDDLQGILDTLPDLLLELGLDGQVYHCHAPRPQLLIAPIDVLLHRRLTDLLPEDAASTCLDALDEAHLQGFSSGRSIRLALEGQTRWLELSIAHKKRSDPEAPRFTVLARDVTERKQAETALQESELRYRTLGEAIPYGVWTADATGYCTYASRSFLDMVGMTLAQVQAFGWLHLLPPEDVESTKAHWLRCVQTGEAFEREHRFRASDGRWRHVLAIGRAMREGETISAWVGINLDITARKQTEEALRAALAKAEAGERMLGTLMASVPEGITLCDSDGQLRMVSQHGQDLLGGSHAGKSIEAVVKDWTVYRPDGETLMPTPELPLMRALAGERVQDVELVQINAAGRRLPLLCNAAPILDGLGRIVAAVVAWRDISPLKAAEAALRNSEERYRNLFENMAEEVHLWQLVRDADGTITTWRLVDANPPALKTWGRVSIEAIRGKTTDEIFGPGATAHYLQVVRRIMTERTPHSFEDYFPHLDKHFRFNSVPLDDQFITTGSDITALKKAHEALHESEERLRLLGDNLPDSAVYQYRHEPDGRVRFLYFSAGIERLNGVSVGEVLRDSGTLHRQIPPEFLDQLIEAEARSRRELSDFDLEIPMRRGDGELRWMRLHSRPRRLPDGRTVWDGVQIDITAQRLAEEALRQNELRYRTLVEATSAVTWSCPPSGLHVRPQPAWMAFTGQSEEEMLGAGWTKAVHPDDVTAAAECWAGAVARGEPFVHEQRIRRRDGQWRWMSVHAVPIRDADGRILEWAGMNLDITERKDAEVQVRQLAFYDPLTGLPNRRLLDERLSQALTEAKRYAKGVAVLVLDLDLFKQINDSLGHAIGDALLVEVARRMTACVRASDTVARSGGDEFTLVLPGLEAEGAAHLAEKLVAQLAAPLQLDGHELTIGCSLGISLFPSNGDVGGDLISRADTAMYRAKQSGRNRYQFFTEEMQREALRIMTLEHQLRRALRGCELCLHYQPQVALDDGRPIGFEALVRWCHPARGLLGPDQFVPLAESSGLIVDLGAWVLRAVMEQLQAWVSAELPPLPVAINLSAQQFRHRDRRQALCTQVSELLAATGLDPALLELEITENSLLEETEGTLATLQGLRARGMRLALDDFGTGYSSLGTLNAFPVDRLKIDQSFVHAASEHPKQAAIVETILALGRHLDFEVIAEGVETATQLEHLRGLGCEQAQGYYFSRPLLPAEAEDWLKRAAHHAEGTSGIGAG